MDIHSHVGHFTSLAYVDSPLDSHILLPVQIFLSVQLIFKEIQTESMCSPVSLTFSLRLNKIPNAILHHDSHTWEILYTSC